MMRTPDFLRFAALTVGAFLIVWISACPTWGGPGFTWDEVYYYPPFKDVAHWVKLPLTGEGGKLSTEGIIAGWLSIRELPPVVKWLGALSLTIAPAEGWGRLWAMRLVPSAAYALTILLIYMIGRRLRSDLCGAIAAAVYIMLPRLFAHGQLAATETVFTSVTMLVAWVVLGGKDTWRWKFTLAICTGVALATKVNGIILFAVILFWLATRRAIAARRRSSPASLLPSGGDWATIALVLVFAPLVALAIWPWMWDATMLRLKDYYTFIREHAHYGVWYFGRRWGFPEGVNPPVPPSYPFVFSHLVTPAWILVLFWLSMVVNGIAWLRRRRIPAGPYLILLLMLAPLAAVSLPGTPRYDGLRLFHPVFAPAALLSVLGLFRSAAWLRRRGWAIPGRPAQRHVVYTAGILMILAVQAFVLRPSIDFYNMPTRLLTRGEAFFPFEQTYWGNAITPRLVSDLNESLPPDARVKTLAFHGATFPLLQEFGLLRDDIVFDGEPPYTHHLLQVRRGFWGNAEWSIYSRTPLHQWGSGVHGEPLIVLTDGAPP